MPHSIATFTFREGTTPPLCGADLRLREGTDDLILAGKHNAQFTT